MKTILFALLITISCSSQNKTSINNNPAFTYSWIVSDGCLTIRFANNHQYQDLGNSTDAIGIYTTSCRNTFLDLIDMLILFGNYPTRVNEINQIDTLTFNLMASTAYILISDTSGHLWKISKPQALILANQLNQTIWINQMNECIINCCVSKN